LVDIWRFEYGSRPLVRMSLQELAVEMEEWHVGGGKERFVVDLCCRQKRKKKKKKKKLKKKGETEQRETEMEGNSQGSRKERHPSLIG
jgi:hypothetical protein